MHAIQVVNHREESIEGQVRECTAFAERKGYYGEDYTLSEKRMLPYAQE